VAHLNRIAADPAEDETVRAAAVFWGTPPVELVAGLVEHRDGGLAEAAIHKAGQMRDPRCLAPLYRVACGYTDTRYGGETYLAACLALGEYGDRRAQVLIANALREKVKRFDERRKKIGPENSPYQREGLRPIEQCLPLIDKLPTEVRYPVLVGLLEDPDFGHEAAKRLPTKGEQNFLKLIVIGLRKSMAKELAGGSDYRQAGDIMNMVRDAVPRDPDSAAPPLTVERLRELEKTLPDPPADASRGWAALPPPESVLEEP
jgi:hypothetical protein